MLQVSNFVALNIKEETNLSGGFLVTLAVTGDGTGSFQTVNFDLFKPEKEKLLVFMCISLNADSVAPNVAYESSFVC